MGKNDQDRLVTRENGEKARSPFSDTEMDRRQATLYRHMADADIDCCLFASIRPGRRRHCSAGIGEHEVAPASTAAMVPKIANSFRFAELMDTWTWFQSGINTDGAENITGFPFGPEHNIIPAR